MKDAFQFLNYTYERCFSILEDNYCNKPLRQASTVEENSFLQNIIHSIITNNDLCHTLRVKRAPIKIPTHQDGN